MNTGGKLKMKIKVKKILSLVFTLLCIVLSSIGLALYYASNAFDASKATSFLPFTINSNIFLAIVGLLFLIVGIISLVEDRPLPQWVVQLKLASVTLVSITFLVVIFYLAPLWGIDDTNKSFYLDCNLFLHVLAPLFAIIGFVLFDVETKIKWRWNWLGTLFVLVYASLYIALIFVNEDLGYDIYNFAHEKNSSSIDILRMVISLVAMIAGSYALANLWWALNHLSYKCTYKEDAKCDEDAPKEEKKVKEASNNKQPTEEEKQVAPLAKPSSAPTASKHVESSNKTHEAAKPVASSKVATPTKKVASKPASNLYNGNTRTYHISTTKSLLGKWQVKLAGGEKAIKVCATQQEAIDYTRELVKSQGGSIRLHSLDGRIRKI